MSDLNSMIEDSIRFHELQLKSMTKDVDERQYPAAISWYKDAARYTETALEALREKQERERGWGCAYCVIGRRSPDARYCSNCGRKLTPALPELANESEEVNPDSHQYVDNDSTNRRKSVKQKGRNLHSETAETCTVTQPDPDTGLMPCGCNWCGPERIGWFSVQFWVRACYGKRKWMSVTQDWKKKVKYCPMCGRKLESK